MGTPKGIVALSGKNKLVPFVQEDRGLPSEKFPCDYLEPAEFNNVHRRNILRIWYIPFDKAAKYAAIKAAEDAQPHYETDNQPRA